MCRTGGGFPMNHPVVIWGPLTRFVAHPLAPTFHSQRVRPVFDRVGSSRRWYRSSSPNPAREGSHRCCSRGNASTPGFFNPLNQMSKHCEIGPHANRLILGKFGVILESPSVIKITSFGATVNGQGQPSNHGCTQPYFGGENLLLLSRVH
ncbi:MAG: hypothetical protein Ct9H90mP16_12740 [Candidatus Poseidoniales archaeon]|nr:MAG: hypothetical protein Ct9H90mP16_12740 [Candidatus Poseidoniales archaeon]